MDIFSGASLWVFLRNAAIVEKFITQQHNNVNIYIESYEVMNNKNKKLMYFVLKNFWDMKNIHTGNKFISTYYWKVSGHWTFLQVQVSGISTKGATPPPSSPSL